MRFDFYQEPADIVIDLQLRDVPGREALEWLRSNTDLHDVPVFLIAGVKARIAALVIAFNMFMSVVIAHRDIVFVRNDFGGWMIELNVFYFMTSLVIFFSGSGRYSLSRGKGYWD